MPATLDFPDIADRLERAHRLQSEIEKLERKLAALVIGVPRHLLSRNRYGFTIGEMTKIARNLHATAKKNIENGRSKELGNSLEKLLSGSAR